MLTYGGDESSNKIHPLYGQTFQLPSLSDFHNLILRKRLPLAWCGNNAWAESCPKLEYFGERLAGSYDPEAWWTDRAESGIKVFPGKIFTTHFKIASYSIYPVYGGGGEAAFTSVCNSGP